MSPLHRLWRSLPAAPRRALLAYGAARLAPRRGTAPAKTHEGVVLAGEVMRASGLGEGARILHAALGELGVASWMIAAGVAVPGEPLDEPPPADTIATAPASAPLILCINAPQLPAALLRLPRGRLRGRVMVGFWNWELPLLPNTWRPALDLVHEVWVPSQFTADAVTGILPSRDAPVLRVVPYPLALVPPRVATSDRTAIGLPPDAVIVLVSFSLASGLMRKNPLGAIAAFRTAFGDRPDRLLVLKVGKTEHYRGDLAQILEATGHAANIRVETRTLPSAERHALTACADIVLSLHRSEGFGLVPAEAMLLGKPVVATGWSGNMTFMDADSASLVDFRLVPVSDPRGVYRVAGAVWAEPDIAEAAARLVELADDAALRATLGHRGQDFARRMLGGEALAGAVRALGGITSSAASS